MLCLAARTHRPLFCLFYPHLAAFRNVRNNWNANSLATIGVIRVTCQMILAEVSHGNVQPRSLPLSFA